MRTRTTQHFPVPANQSVHTGKTNQKFVHATLTNHRKKIFSAMPDWTRYRLVRGHLRQELEMGFDFRLRQLSLELDTALHQVREQCNHALVTGKAQLRKERMEFFADSYHDVTEQFNDLADRFLTDLDRRLERLEKYKSPVIRAREEERLTGSVDAFLNTLDQLVEEYRGIISEQVGRDSWE